MLKKYGVEHAMNSKEIFEIYKKTNIKKFGVEFPMRLDEIKYKQRESVLKKYGVSHISKTDKFRKMASKNMCKYNANIISNHTIRKYKNLKLYYQSQYEYEFLELCEKLNIINEITNAKRFKYKNGKFHKPDFNFKNKFIIEIKSTYWMNRQGGIELINEKKESVELKGYKYVFILDKNYKNFLDIL